MKTNIQIAIFCLGLLLLGLSFLPAVGDPLLRTWLALAALVIESLFAIYLVREDVAQYPQNSSWEHLAPASLPLAVGLICVLRVFNVFGS